MNNFFHFTTKVQGSDGFTRVNNYPFVKVQTYFALLSLVRSMQLHETENCEGEREKRKSGSRLASWMPSFVTRQTNLCPFASSSNTCHEHSRDIACQPRWPQTISQRCIIHDRTALVRSLVTLRCEGDASDASDADDMSDARPLFSARYTEI